MKYLIIYLEIEHMLNFLTQSEKGDFLDLMISYAKDQEDPIIENKNVLNVFNFIRGRLDIQFEKAKAKADIARKNGKGGGRPPAKRKPRKTQPKPKITQSVIDPFDEFWDLYDKKKSKPEAKKKFELALKKESFENIMLGLQSYVKSRGTDTTYWKHPATWLNKECWNDEHKLTTSKPSTKHNLEGKDYDRGTEGFNVI